jgi:hypothetical protein
MPQIPHALEKTIIYDDYVMHYTCNPPSADILKKHKIVCVGDRYKCNDPREILLIPKKLYKKKGLLVRQEDIIIISETLLKSLTK